MKKIPLLILLLTALGTVKTFAQSSATANLSITLSDVSSIAIVTATPLSFNFNTETAYTNGVAITEDNHLNVLSSRNYVVSVNAGTITGPHTLDASSVNVTASAGTTGGVYTGIASYPSLSLTASPVALITSTASTYTGTTSRSWFKIVYNVGANNAYAGKTGSVTPDVIPVVYTLTQP